MLIHKMTLYQAPHALIPGRPIAVAEQWDTPTVWFETDPNQPVSHEIITVGTGHKVPEGWTHVDTIVNVSDTGLVLHYYSRPT